MPSIGPDRGGDPASSDPLAEKQDGAAVSPAEDDSIEILEVVGVPERPDEPSPEDQRPRAVDGAGEGSAGGPAGEPGESGDEAERLREQLLRVRADFENFRKRTAREKAHAHDRAVAELLEHLLPVIDNLDRALRSDGAGSDPFRQGIGLIRQQLMEVLSRHGLAPIATGDALFDPHLHEAVEMVHKEGAAPGSIVEEMRTGYLMKGRLLRPALVKVASGRGRAGPGDDGAEPAR